MYQLQKLKEKNLILLKIILKNLKLINLKKKYLKFCKFIKFLRIFNSFLKK